MAESIVEIVLRVKDDAGKIIAKTLSDIQALQNAASGVSAPGAAKIGEDLSKVGEGVAEAVTEINKLGEAAEKVVAPATSMGKAVEGAGSSAAKAGAGMSQAGQQAAKAGQQAAKGAKGFKEADDASKSVSMSFGKLMDTLRGVGPALVGIFALNKLKDLADVGAKIQVTGTVLKVVANNAGIAGSAITTLDKEIQGLGITAKDSGESLTKFIQAGLAGVNNESLGKAKELARAAQDLAVVSGENSSETFSRMIINIQQMDTMGMRFMGINVNMEKAQEKFAASIGKTAAELTDAEKKQAFMNATLVEATKLQGTYEAAMGDTAKQLTSLPRLQNELAAVVSENLQPAYSALIVTFSDFLKEAKKVAEEWGKAGDGGIKFGEAVKVVATALKNVTLLAAEQADVILKVLATWAAFKAISLIGTTLVALAGNFVAVTAALSSFGSTLIFVGQIVTASVIPPLLRLIAIPLAPFAATAVASFSAMAAGSGGLAAALTVLRTGFTALVTTLGPLAVAIGAIWLVWEAVSSKMSKKKLISPEERADAEKELAGMVKATVEARDKMMAAREKANALGNDADTQKVLDKQVKEAENEYKIAQAKQERFAKEKGLTAEKIADIDKEMQAELKLNQTMKQIEAEQESLKQARQNLGITDKDNQDSIDKAKKMGAAFTEVLKATTASLYSIPETFQQRLDRVTASGEESVQSIARKSREAGLTVEQYLEKFYPTPERAATWEELGAAIAKGGENAQKAFRQMSEGFDKFVQSAKSPEEIALALDKVGGAAGLMVERVLAAKETLKFNAEKAEVDRLNQALSGMAAHLSLLRSGMETVAMVTKDTAASQRAWDQVMLGLKGSFDQFGHAVISAGQSMSLFSSNTQQMSASQAQATMEALNAAKTRYDQEVSLEKALYDKKKAMASEYGGSEKEQGTRIGAIDKESLGKRIENAKEFYNTLKSLQADALNNFKAYADKVKELDKAIYQSREQRESDIRDIRRKGMSEEEQTADKIAEYNELMEKAKQAASAKSWEKMQDYATRAKELAKGLNIDLGSQEQMVGDAWDQVIAAQEKQKEEAKKAAEEQLAAYNKVSESLKTLSDQLVKMTGEQTAKVLIDVDQTSLTEAMAKVKEAFASMQIKVAVVPDTSASASFAVGGMVDGPGTETSDSILAAVSKNEFINTARSVRHYGSDLFYALNSMRIPRDAIRSVISGGSSMLARAASAMVPTGLPRFNVGGLVGGSSGPSAPSVQLPAMALDLTFNQRPIGRVAGSRETISNLVTALKEVSRGS